MAYEIVKKHSFLISNQTRRISLHILESYYLLKEKEVDNDKYENSTLHFIESTQRLLLSGLAK